jgi:hypothetical protein
VRTVGNGARASRLNDISCTTSMASAALMPRISGRGVSSWKCSRKNCEIGVNVAPRRGVHRFSTELLRRGRAAEMGATDGTDGGSATVVASGGGGGGGGGGGACTACVAVIPPPGK